MRVIRTREGEALVSVSRIAEDDVDAADLNPSDGDVAALPVDSEGAEGSSE